MHLGSGQSNWHRHLPLALVGCLGIGLSVAGFHVTKTWETTKAQSVFERTAADHAKALQLGIGLNVEVISSLADFLARAGKVDRRDFTRFVNGILRRHPEIKALEWIPRVTAIVRRSYEEAARMDGLSGFQITEADPDGDIMAAGPREEYFPVYYVEPYEDNQQALGFDLASNETRRRALDLARDTGTVVSTARTTLVQETGQKFGFLVFAPIYLWRKPHETIEQRRQNLAGYALGVFRIGDLIESTLQKLNTVRGLDFYVYDEHADPGKRFLYFHPSRLRRTPTAALPGEYVRAGVHTTQTLNVAGRTWTIVFRPSPGQYETTTWTAWATLIAGVLLTATLLLYLMSVQGRTQYISKRVAETTEELTSKNAKLKFEIAERSEAETALRKSEAWLKAIVDHAPSSIYLKDLEGSYILINQEFERVNKSSKLDVLGKNAFDVFPQDWAKIFVEHDRDVLQAGRAVEKEILDEPRSDGPHSYLAVKFPVFDDRESIMGIGGIETDITERKHAEQLLEDSEARIRAIVDTVLDGIVTIDERGLITTFNSAAERLFGYDVDKIVGENVRILMPEPYHSEHDGYIHNYLGTGEAKIIGLGREVKGQRADGTTFPMELAVSEMYWGGQRMFTGIVRDITERKETEEELRQSYELLEDRVEERTAELRATNRKLQKEIAERKSAEQALRDQDERLLDLQRELTQATRVTAMAQVSSSLAHELNQPLAAIVNYSQAARRLIQASNGQPSVKLFEIIDKTVDQATRAANIVRGLRDIVDRGETKRKEEDLNACVEEACALALTGVASKGVKIDLDLAVDSPAVLINRVQIQQVIVNLVRNALEAMVESEQRELVVRTSLAANNLIELAVMDNGEGLVKEVQEQLFQPFFTTKSDGMGIGLSISQSIIETHGGSIWVTSNPDRGVTFHFTLPIVTKAIEADER